MGARGAPKRFGAMLVVAMRPEAKARLERLAEARGEAFSAMARRWLEERLVKEERAARRRPEPERMI